MHQDPVLKSQRLTDSNGNLQATIELDPWGGDTNRSWQQQQQPRKYTTYERDAEGGDEAMRRRYNSWWSRFLQPDPYDGSYNLTDPQSLNRYSYVQNDPVNYVDPTGLQAQKPQEGTNCGAGKMWERDPDTGALECKAADEYVYIRLDPFTSRGNAALLALWDPLRGVRGGTDYIEWGGGGRGGTHNYYTPTRENSEIWEMLKTKWRMEQCLADSSAEFDKQFNRLLSENTGKGLLPDPTEAIVGTGNNLSWSDKPVSGIGVQGAVANTATGFLAFKGVKAYGGLLIEGYQSMKRREKCMSRQ